MGIKGYMLTLSHMLDKGDATLLLDQFLRVQTVIEVIFDFLESFEHPLFLIDPTLSKFLQNLLLHIIFIFLIILLNVKIFVLRDDIKITVYLLVWSQLLILLV